ncbi:2-dehydropantoate 2-reductase [Cercospora zeina]
MKNCNVLVYGGGAVGSIFGWRIAQNSHATVSVVCRSNWNAVRTSGYTLDTKTWGRGHFFPHQVLKSGSLAKGMPRRKWDYLILATKITDDYASTIADLESAVSPETTLVAAQNGMDVEVPLAQAFRNNTILSAVCSIGCTQVSPGRIEQTASMKRSAFLIGAYDPSGSADIRKRDTLSAMDDQFESVDGIEQERWRKLVINATWNSVTALMGKNTHQVLEEPGAAELMSQIAREAHSVASASGVSLDNDLPVQVIEVAKNSAPFTPSTLQDLRNSRPLELAPIFGYLILQARRVGLPVPYLTWVHELLQQRNSQIVERTAPHEPSWGGSPSVVDLLAQEAPPTPSAVA